MSSFIILLTLFTTLIVSLYFYVKQSFSYWQRKGVKQLQPKFPLGNLAKTFSQKLSFTDEIKSFYQSSDAPILGIYSLLQPILLVRDPDLIQNILVKDFVHFNHYGWQLNENVDPMSKNILMLKDEKWKNVRSMLSPAFSSGKLKAMFETIMDCGQSLTSHFESYAGSIGQSVEITDVFSRFTINVIASVAFGIQVDSIKNPDDDFRKYGIKLFETSFNNVMRKALTFSVPKLARFFRLRFVDKDVGDFMINIVQQNLEHREMNGIVRKDFFQSLMQLRNTGSVENDGQRKSPETKFGNFMSLDEMAAHAYLFLVGGFESTATLMSFCMYELAKEPAIQEKVYQEIVQISEKHNGKITYESLSDMKYFGFCVEETLRLHPPFGFSIRCCSKDYQIPETKVMIEKGTSVIMSISGIQSDPKYWNEPDKFIPERFENNQLDAKVFLAFGGGPKICMGSRLAQLQVKLGISILLQRFKFELADQHKGKELKIDPKSASKSALDGIHLTVETR